MGACEKRLTFWIPLVALVLPLLALLVALVGIQANINLFFGVYIASTMLFLVVVLSIFAFPSILLFVRLKQKEKNRLTPERDRLWIVLAAILFVMVLGVVYFTYIGPLVVHWPPCTSPDDICWAGITIPYWLHTLGFFGYGLVSVFALPYLWFVFSDFFSKRLRKTKAH